MYLVMPLNFKKCSYFLPSSMTVCLSSYIHNKHSDMPTCRDYNQRPVIRAFLWRGANPKQVHKVYTALFGSGMALVTSTWRFQPKCFIITTPKCSTLPQLWNSKFSPNAEILVPAAYPHVVLPFALPSSLTNAVLRLQANFTRRTSAHILTTCTAVHFSLLSYNKNVVFLAAPRHFLAR